MSLPRFRQDHTDFYTELRLRVDKYFSERRLSRHANGAMYLKSSVFLASAVTLYFLFLFGNFSLLTSLVLATLLGACSAFIGFNVCHDALHGSYSGNKYVNSLLGSIFHLLGASPYNWKISHNIVHHTYTNIHDHDDDLIVAPGLISVCPQDKPTWIQRYQQYYAFALYGMASLSWIFVKDYVKFFQSRIGHFDTRKHPNIEYVKLFLFKLIYYVLVIVLPIVLMKLTWWQFLIGFTAMQVAKGLVLGLVFQLAHIVEGLDFPEPAVNGNIEDVWAAHQLRTTSNFGVRSNITTFFCGGLNMQVEHHLFPHVCHIHYPALSSIVKETAKEYNLPYHENSSFLSALGSHFRMLRKFGQPVMG